MHHVWPCGADNGADDGGADHITKPSSVDQSFTRSHAEALDESQRVPDDVAVREPISDAERKPN